MLTFIETVLVTMMPPCVFISLVMLDSLYSRLQRIKYNY